VRQLNIKEGDKLHWEFAVENGEIIVKFRKIKGYRYTSMIKQKICKYGLPKL
jgi:hypothetical protein